MIPLIEYIKRNVYIRQPGSSLASQKFLEAFNRNNCFDPKIILLHALIKYPRWHKEISLFPYLNRKMFKQLRKNPKVFFMLDASTEGFSTIYGNTPFFDILYYNCKKFHVPPEKMIFISSNMVEEQNLIRYNTEHGIDRSINVACFNNFEQMLFNMKKETLPQYDIAFNPVALDKLVEARYLEVLRDTKRFYYGEKYFLSLSRVNRPHRILSAYELFNSKIFDKGIVSHNKIKSTSENLYALCSTLPANCGITPNDLARFSKYLPLVADTNDFETNHAMALNSHLNNATLFQVVGETFADDCWGTSRFWSEKTFRSIFHMQPFIVWGQPNANKNLQDYGYKLYDKMFNYSFDTEKDTYKRWTMILNVINDTVKHLNKMSKAEHLEWLFQQQDVLKHNYKVMYRENHTKEVFKKLAFKIIKLTTYEL